MMAQVALFGAGVWLLFKGEVAAGLFNTFFNAVFFVMNMHTLKAYNKEEQK